MSRGVARFLLTVDEAAMALKIGRSHLYHYVQTGQLRSVKLGRSRRIPVDSLDEFVKSLQAEEQVSE